MFLRRKVGTSKSWPSTIVGSLFSKRPRVTGSNCIISCFAWVFSFGVFGCLTSFSATGSFSIGFFFGGINRGADFFIGGACGGSRALSFFVGVLMLSRAGVWGGFSR